MNSVQTHASSSSILSGCWQLAAGHAITLKPRWNGVLRVAHGSLWVTVDGQRVGAGNQSGDLMLHAGDELALRRGQRVVMESLDAQHSAWFAWDPVPVMARSASRWQVAVVQPLLDLRLALGLAGAALTRLLLGLVGLLVTPARAGLEAPAVARDRGDAAARALSALSSARRAQGAIKSGDSIALSGAV
jgi:hypothetical protein